MPFICLFIFAIISAAIILSVMFAKLYDKNDDA